MKNIKKIIIYIFNKILPKNKPIRIFLGPLFGLKWYYFSSVPSFYFGHFEIKKVRLFIKNVIKKKSILDIGANVGYYSLLAVKYAESDCKIYAFEPSKRNFEYLIKNVEANNIKNIFSIEKAIIDKEEEVFLQENDLGVLDTVGGESGDYKVLGISIDNFCDNNKITPDLIKMDIEGGELLALQGAINTLKKYSPDIFLSAHSDKLEEECLSFLSNLGYKYEKIEDGDFLLKI